MISVDFYYKSTGECPVQEYLDSLSSKLRAKTLRTVMLLEEFGTELRMPYSENKRKHKKHQLERLKKQKNFVLIILFRRTKRSELYE